VITLAEIEQETARRVGPYRRYFTDRQIPNTATFDYCFFPTLKSNIDVDGPTNLWLLRRGIDYQGNPVAFDIVDRQRLVSTWEPSSGEIRTDRAWGTPCAPGEYVEFHHLDPEQELRQAVLAGLSRCFFLDTAQIQPDGLWLGVDLTAQLPWLTDPGQVVDCYYGWLAPYGHAPFSAHMEQGHVVLSGTSGPYVPASMGTLWVTALRPHLSWVNGATSTTGPLLDTDTLSVDLNYAASAGHIEAWHLFPDRLQAAGAGGLQASQSMAAAEFTRQALIWGPKRSTSFGLDSVFSLSASRGWVNGPAPW
jgi:hypothetical protein